MKNNKRILLVDDIPEYLDDFAMLLPESTEAVKAGTIKDAITLIEQLSPDLCIIDIRLDEDNPENREGMNLLQWIKKFRPAIPVIMVSAYHEFEFETEALGLGAAYFLRKPISPDLFEKVVKNILGLEKT
ncbi:MAG: response regulator [Desulfobacterales bacterium]|nr:response regulator [Desulfobacterales bacterium]